MTSDFNPNIAANNQIVNIELLKCIKESEAEGMLLYRQIDELRDIATVMEHPEFNKFYKKYLNTDNIEGTLNLLGMYENISRELLKLDPKEECHNAYHKIFILSKLLEQPSIMDTASNQ